MIIRRKKRSSQSGTAIISSLFLVTIVASLGAGLVQVSSVSTKKQVTGIDTARALYIAEAGLSEAYLAVAQGRSGELGSVQEPAEFGDGYYWVEATDLPDDQVQLEATGLVGHGRFTLAMILRRSVNEIGSLGMCGLKDVTIGEGAQLDILEVNVDGSPVSKVIEDPKPTKIRSNGDITVHAPAKGGATTRIEGSIHPGPNGIADLDPGVVVTGTVAGSSRGITLPSFKIPRLGVSNGNVSFPREETALTLETDVAYDNVFIPEGKQITLKGPMRLRVENLVVNGGGELIIDTSNGPVGIYTTGATIFDVGSNLSNIGADPTQCSLFALTPERSDKSTVSLLGSGAFFGMIVAPKSLVDVPGDLRLAGSIVSESLNIGANAHVSFTPQLEKAGYGIEMTPTIVAWQILDVPDTVLTRGGDSIDFKLKVNAIPTKRSATSAPEVEVTLKYVSTAKVNMSFTGLVTDIPWANISHVDTVRWKKGAALLDERAPKVIIEAVDAKTGNADIVDQL